MHVKHGMQLNLALHCSRLLAPHTLRAVTSLDSSAVPSGCALTYPLLPPVGGLGEAMQAMLSAAVGTSSWTSCTSEQLSWTAGADADCCACSFVCSGLASADPVAASCLNAAAAPVVGMGLDGILLPNFRGGTTGAARVDAELCFAAIVLNSGRGLLGVHPEAWSSAAAASPLPSVRGATSTSAGPGELSCSADSCTAPAAAPNGAAAASGPTATCCAGSADTGAPLAATGGNCSAAAPSAAWKMVLCASTGSTADLLPLKLCTAAGAATGFAHGGLSAGAGTGWDAGSEATRWALATAPNLAAALATPGLTSGAGAASGTASEAGTEDD